MNVFISYSHHDKKYADRIADRLEIEGHNIWIDSWKLRAGDNIYKKLNEGLKLLSEQARDTIGS